jgi:hypothetical protein
LKAVVTLKKSPYFRDYENVHVSQFIPQKKNKDKLCGKRVVDSRKLAMLWDCVLSMKRTHEMDKI